jgi:hypothetical protein
MPMHLGRDNSALEAAPKGSTASARATAAAATVPVWMEMSSACWWQAGANEPSGKRMPSMQLLACSCRSRAASRGPHSVVSPAS